MCDFYIDNFAYEVIYYDMFSGNVSFSIFLFEERYSVDIFSIQWIISLQVNKRLRFGSLRRIIEMITDHCVCFTQMKVQVWQCHPETLIPSYISNWKSNCNWIFIIILVKNWWSDLISTHNNNCEMVKHWANFSCRYGYDQRSDYCITVRKQLLTSKLDYVQVCMHC